MRNENATPCKDGLKEQAELLGALSRTLDEYFQIPTVPGTWRRDE